MTFRRFENIIMIGAAFAAAGIVFGLLQERDERILDPSSRWEHRDRIFTVPPTDEEIRIAEEFGERTLPALRQLGLIIHYTRTEAETVITVSGKIWNERSMFFRQKFLEHVFTYHKVNNYPLRTRVIDHRTSQLYAQIIPPDQRLVY